MLEGPRKECLLFSYVLCRVWLLKEIYIVGFFTYLTGIQVEEETDFLSLWLQKTKLKLKDENDR